jgi:hypothetical protein
MLENHHQTGQNIRRPVCSARFIARVAGSIRHYKPDMSLVTPVKNFPGSTRKISPVGRNHRFLSEKKPDFWPLYGMLGAS